MQSTALANPQCKNRLSLSLLVFRIDANHTHHALAVNDFALITHFFDRSSDFHFINPLSSSCSEPLSLVAVSNSSAVQVVRRQLHQHPVARKNPDEMLAHLSRNVRQHLMLCVFQLDPKHSVRQSLADRRHNLYSFFLRHIRSERILPCTDKLQMVTCPNGFAKPRWPLGLQTQVVVARSASEPFFAAILVSTSGPSSLIAMVCSVWALGLPSSVTTVQPSAKTLVWCVPKLIIGSTAKT